jgi:hypothetical protein
MPNPIALRPHPAIKRILRNADFCADPIPQQHYPDMCRDMAEEARKLAVALATLAPLNRDQHDGRSDLRRFTGRGNVSALGFMRSFREWSATLAAYGF